MAGPIAWKPIAAEAAWQDSTRGAVVVARAPYRMLRLADAAVKRLLFAHVSLEEIELFEEMEQ